MESTPSKTNHRQCPGLSRDDRRFVVSNIWGIIFEVITLVAILGITAALLYIVIDLPWPSIFAFDSSWYIGVSIAASVFLALTLYLGLSQRTVRVELDKNSGLMAVTRMRYLFFTKTITIVPLNEIARIHQFPDYLSMEGNFISLLHVRVYFVMTNGANIYICRDSYKSVLSKCFAEFLGVPIEKDSLLAWRRWF